MTSKEWKAEAQRLTLEHKRVLKDWEKMQISAATIAVGCSASAVIFSILKQYGPVGALILGAIFMIRETFRAKKTGQELASKWLELRETCLENAEASK